MDRGTELRFLHEVRRAEAVRLAKLLTAGAKILDIGGGTGIQARTFSELGFDVTSIHLPRSAKAAERVWPVIDYDGDRFPIRDASVDIAFSSNVLEHVRNPGRFHEEVKRVLRPGGAALHVVPTAVWRLANALVHPLATLHGYRCFLERAVLPVARSPLIAPVLALRGLVPYARLMFLVPRHGERGSALTELWSFSTPVWLRHFRTHGFRVVRSGAMGEFYTGQPVADARLSMRRRVALAKVVGSGAHYFLLRPAP